MNLVTKFEFSYSIKMMLDIFDVLFERKEVYNFKVSYCQSYENFFRSHSKFRQNKLECLFLLSFIIVSYLRVGLKDYT